MQRNLVQYKVLKLFVEFLSVFAARAAFHHHQPCAAGPTGTEVFHHWCKVFKSRQRFTWDGRVGGWYSHYLCFTRAVRDSSKSFPPLHHGSRCAQPCWYLHEKQLLGDIAIWRKIFPSLQAAPEGEGGGSPQPGRWIEETWRCVPGAAVSRHGSAPDSSMHLLPLQNNLLFGSLRTISVIAQTESTPAALAWSQPIHKGPSRNAPSDASLPVLCHLHPRALLSLILLTGTACVTRYKANGTSRDKVHAALQIGTVTHIIQFVYLLIHLLITTGNYYQSRELLKLPTACSLGKRGTGSPTTQVCGSLGGSYGCYDSLVLLLLYLALDFSL